MTVKRLVTMFEAWAPAACLMIAWAARSALAERKPPEPVTVKKVVSAQLTLTKGSLTVNAVGEVPTAGFTKPTFTRATYIKQPDDSIQDYTFEAVPPTGISTQVVSKVTVTDTWRSLPGWVKGVRIHGVRDRVRVKMLGDKDN